MILEIIGTLIATGKTFLVFKELLDYLSSLKKSSIDSSNIEDVENIIISLESRYKNIEFKEKIGVISQSDSLLEKNKITVSILNIVNEINASSGPNLGAKVFLSYSYRDREKVEVVKSSLYELAQDGFISLVIDSEILPGENFSDELKKQIDNSDIIIMVVSKNYQATFSTYRELFYILGRQKKKSENLMIVSLDGIESVESIISNSIVNYRIINFNSKKKDKVNIFKEVIIDFIKNNLRELSALENEYNLLKQKLIKSKSDQRRIDIIDSIIEIQQELHDEVKLNQYLRKKKEYQFRLNLKLPVKIEKIEIEGVSIFSSIEWNLSPSINILLGKNGYGKSYLLRLIACFLQNEKDIMDDDYEMYSFSTIKGRVVQNSKWNNILYKECEFKKGIGKIPILAIPSTRNISPNLRIDVVKTIRGMSLSEMGAATLTSFYSFEALIKDLFYVYGNDLIKFSKDNPHLENSIAEFDLTKIIESVFYNLTGDTFKISRIEEYIGQTQMDIFVNIEGSDKPVLLQKISQGTLSLLSIVMLIYYYLKSCSAGNSDTDIANQSGIVFIDEVDAHLHPAWQQKIVSILRNTFPSVQFILTAHSPLIVSGTLENEVSCLIKDDNNEFRIKQFSKNFIKKSIEDVYKEVFELSDVNNDDTYLEYLTKLSYTPIKEIELEINKLEKQPNSIEDRKRLNELYRMIQVNQIKVNEQDNLLSQNEDLKIEIRELKRKIKALSK